MSTFVAPLLDAVRARGFRPETVAMDKGYDNNRIYAECAERGVAPVIPLRKGRIDPGSPIPRHTDQWCSLYRRRSAVERLFGSLKHEYGFVLRTRGLRKAQLHADLVMLARLARAVSQVIRPLGPRPRPVFLLRFGWHETPIRAPSEGVARGYCAALDARHECDAYDQARCRSNASAASWG